MINNCWEICFNGVILIEVIYQCFESFGYGFWSSWFWGVQLVMFGDYFFFIDVNQVVFNVGFVDIYVQYDVVVCGFYFLLILFVK